MPVDSGWPASRFAALLDSGALQNQNQLDADLQGWLSEEHKANGEHGAVVADSVTLNPPNPADPLTGKLVLQDEDEKTTAFYRTRALSTVIEMMYGVSINPVTLWRWINSSGAIANVARLGLIQHGSATDHGLSLLAQAVTVYSDWLIASGQGASSTPALIFGNLSTGIDPISLRYRSGSTVYEFMKHVGGAGPTSQTVTLGSGLDSSLGGYFDAAFIKSLNLQTAGNSHAVAGAFVDVAFSAGNFTAGGAQTWTLTGGDQTSFAYEVTGGKMTMCFLLDTTSVGGTPDVELRIAIPLGFTVVGRTIESVGWALDNGVVTIPRFQAGSGNAYISVFNQAGTNWTASTNATSVHGQITFAIA